MKRIKRTPGKRSGVMDSIKPLFSLFCTLMIAGIIFYGSSAMALSDDGFRHGYRSCSITARVAFKSCLHERKADYWLARGKCHNLSQPRDQSECLTDVKMEFWEENNLCLDQREARTDLCGALGEAPYDPILHPGDFLDPDMMTPERVNPYFPLTLGTQWTYEGMTESGVETVVVTVTQNIKEIEYPESSGNIFKCIEIQDVAMLNGEIIEDTKDWFAQDRFGNVWYFGEISKNYEGEELIDLDGSWKAGVNGAKPGIIMHNHRAEDLLEPIRIEVDEPYRQEFLLGEAEDIARVVSLGEETVTIPLNGGTTFDMDVLLTNDRSPIEPDVWEKKYYVPGVGCVLEVNPLKPEEKLMLIEMKQRLPSS